MASRVRVGETVRTPLGLGVVTTIRRDGRVAVDLNGKSLVLQAHDVAPHEARKSRPSRDRHPRVARTSGGDRRPTAGTAPLEVDLHGLTVEAALERADQVINDALLRDTPTVRLIHGRSGGRIRAALHRRLSEISAVVSFRLDPRNAGVTIVEL